MRQSRDDRRFAPGTRGVADDLRCVLRLLRLHHRQLGDARKLVHDRGEPRVGDARRKRIDDENCLHSMTTLP